MQYPETQSFAQFPSQWQSCLLAAMELTGALEAVRARCTPAWHPSTSQPTFSERWVSSSTHQHSSRIFLWRNGRAFRKFEPIFLNPKTRSCPCLATTSGALRPRRGPIFRARAQSAEAEVVEGGESPKVDLEGEKDEGEREREISDEEEFGIDADGNLTNSLPEEFLELMKDEGPAPNYWLVAFGLTVGFLARNAIWAEVKYWGQLVFAAVVGSGTLAVNVLELVFKKLLVWGGDPLAKVIVGLAYIPFTINNVFRFIADIVPPLPVLFAVILASFVLLVGESVSDTYSSSKTEFPSRGILDTAGLLGLGGFVGVIPVEITLLGIAAITGFLLFVRKVNPVAAFTPAAAFFAAVAEPVIRYPVFLSFIGASMYRYWRLGYMESGAVQKERTSEYPRILIALLYLVAVAFAARSCFYIIDRIRVLFAAATV